MIQILQILPRVPPAVCGIGDYAWGIARRLRDEHDMASSFLSAGTSWTQPEGDTEFPVFRLPELTAKALVDFIAGRKGEFDAIVLHLSPYGFQKRGVPLWLAAGWRWMAQLPGRPRLITMFHELYASGSMRSSAFWLQPLQRHVLRVIARASDGLRTNREAYATWLQFVVKGAKGEIPALPVFSNMGESVHEADSPERWNGMTVFASTVDTRHQALVSEACRETGVKRLGWIGRKPPPDIGHDVEVRQVAYLPAQEASAWFNGYGFAFTGYNPDFLAKSGIFAALAAHRLAVVLPTSPSELPDRLMEGREFMTVSGLSSVEDLEGRARRIAAGLYDWYLPHDLAHTAAGYARQIRSLVD